MCSICRNKKCIYRFEVDKWKPEDDLVVIQVPEFHDKNYVPLTMLESVRLIESGLLEMACSVFPLSLPEKK